MLATLFAKGPKDATKPAVNMLAACVDPIKEFLTRNKALSLLALVVLYKIGDAYAGSLTISFLLRGVGFSLTEVGFLNKTIGLIATLFGVFACGVMMARMSLYKALLWFGIVQALSNLVYLVLAYTGARYDLMVACIFLENFGGGLGTAAFMALLMSLCHHQYTATQYALLSALAAVGRVYIGPLAGYMVEHYGWVDFFVWSLLISIPGLILLVLLKNTLQNAEMDKSAEPQSV